MTHAIDVSPDNHPGMVLWPVDEGMTLDRVKKWSGERIIPPRGCIAERIPELASTPPSTSFPGARRWTGLEILIEPAWIAEFHPSARLGAADLETANAPPGIERLLCKTRNSRPRAEDPGFHED